MHVKKFNDDFNGTAVIKFVFFAYKDLLKEQAALFALNNPVAFKRPDVDGEIFEGLRAFIFIHSIFEIEIICVAWATLFDFNNFII